MSEIEIERTPRIQESRPEPVHIKLIGNDGQVKGIVSVWPVLKPIAENNDQFRVEVRSGFNIFDMPIDIRVTI